MNSVTEDKDTIKLLSQGSEEAFAAIYNRHSGMVARVSYHLTGNKEDAKDITQKVFCELNRKAADLKNHRSIGGWLYHTARNLSKTHLRGLSRARQRDKKYYDLYNEEFIDCDSLQIIEDEIQSLPEEYRQLIIRHYYEGYSQSEIADNDDINASTLRNKIAKARELLEKRLKVKGIAVLGVFLSTLESEAKKPLNIPLPDAQKCFHSINKSGGILMKALITTTLAASLAVVLFINFSKAEDSKTKSNEANSAAVQPAKPEEIKSLTKAHNVLGFKMLKQLHEEGKNVFISPTSICTAFGMLHNGTVGDVKTEFEKVFGWREFNADSFNSANKELMSALQSNDKKSTLEIANSIWISKDLEVKPLFKRENIKFFNAEVNNVPFNQATVKRINNWCDQKTHGKIKEVIQELEPEEVMVLINAVYFKGNWTKAFNKNSTRPRDFTLADNSKVKVPLMYIKADLEYSDTEKYQAVRLPFGNGETAMTFILPKGELSDFQKNLNNEKFQKIQANFKEKEIELYVPRFKIEYEISLKDTLMAMGLRKSFGESNGFAKINPTKHMGISKSIHKTFLEVKEEGAEAAAATTILIYGGIESPVMKINRPFMCAITNVKTGNVIFVGSIYNPLK